MSIFLSSLFCAKKPLSKDDTSDPEIYKFAFQEKEYLTIACMKEQVSANSKTVQEGRGKEFSGSTQVHVCRQ